MKNSLERMELLVSQTILPQHAYDLLARPTEIGQIPDWMKEVKKEGCLVKQWLLHKYLHSTGKKGRVSLVKHYQAVIIHLLNRVADYKKTSLSPLSNDLYDCMKIELEELLIELKLKYPEFFNMAGCIPNSDMQRYQPELRAQVRLIKQLFSPVVTDHKLLSVLMTPLCQFAGYSLPINPTYSEMEYMKTLVKNLVPLPHMCTCVSMEETLIEFLIVHNFNSPGFIAYYTGRLKEKLALPEQAFDTINYLAFQLKELLQLQVIPQLSLVPESPSVKEVMVNWLKEELNFLDKQRYKTLGPVFQNAQPVFAGRVEKEKEEVKIKTLFTVPEVALIIRMLHEMKLVEFFDRRGFIKLISRFFTTPGTEKNGMSAASIDSKYSAVEMDTIKSLRKKLRDLNDFLRRLEEKL